MRLFLLCLIFCAADLSAVTAAPVPVLEQFEEARASVVTVKGVQFIGVAEESAPALTPGGVVLLTKQQATYNEQTGAGVILDPQGTIVTNTHVIYGSQFVRVYLKDGRELGAKIIYISPSYDFSLLKIDTIDPLPAITWADSEQLSLGQEVVTIGHSALLNETISGGVIIGWGTRTTEQGDTVEVLQLNINHYPGDSGGPVFDREGRLAGLMNARRTQKDRATLAVPVNKIHFAYLNLAPGTQNK